MSSGLRRSLHGTRERSPACRRASVLQRRIDVRTSAADADATDRSHGSDSLAHIPHSAYWQTMENLRVGTLSPRAGARNSTGRHARLDVTASSTTATNRVHPMEARRGRPIAHLLHFFAPSGFPPSRQPTALLHSRHGTRDQAIDESNGISFGTTGTIPPPGAALDRPARCAAPHRRDPLTSLSRSDEVRRLRSRHRVLRRDVPARRLAPRSLQSSARGSRRVLGRGAEQHAGARHPLLLRRRHHLHRLRGRRGGRAHHSRRLHPADPLKRRNGVGSRPA